MNVEAWERLTLEAAERWAKAVDAPAADGALPPARPTRHALALEPELREVLVCARNLARARRGE